MTVLDRSATAEAGADPFSALTSATGVTQIHFRKQKEMEGALAAIGNTQPDCCSAPLMAVGTPRIRSAILQRSCAGLVSAAR